MNRDRLIKLLFSLVGLLILAFSLWILNQKLSKYNFNDVVNSLLAISDRQIFWAIGLTCLGYLVISTYDLIAFRHFNLPLDSKKIIFTAFLTYAISNVTGFTLLIGSSIRYRFYSGWGISTKNIAKIIAFSNLSFCLGAIAVGGIACTFNNLAASRLIQLNLITVRTLGLILMAMLGLYFYCCHQQKSVNISGVKYYFPPFITSFCQVITFSLDWASAAAVLYVLLPANANLTYINFYSIFFLAMTVSIVSHVPGGLGVFETVILWLLPPNIYTPDALSSFLSYRAIRQLLPFILAICLLSISEIYRQINHIKKKQN